MKRHLGTTFALSLRNKSMDQLSFAELEDENQEAQDPTRKVFEAHGCADRLAGVTVAV